ncbi:MAG: peptide ABC transporter substrate-binding protein [Eubacteriaceae bacterium]|nr:peptide ABC transporter substrate-binding protein [Eubacteriaceae bacterium]
MKTKKAAAIMLALACALTLASCTPGTGSGAAGGEATVVVGPAVRTLDPALNASVDGSTYLTNAFAGIYSYKKSQSGGLELQPECATEIVTPTPLGDGRYQYVITLKEGLKWSDGVEVKASDFEYAWKRAADPATKADYQYIFDVIDGYDESAPNLNVTSDDAARTVTVVTSSFCAYFDQLLAFATYYPVRKDIVEANPEQWAVQADTYITNGPFKLENWDLTGSQLVFAKNENYWDAANVKLDKLIFAMSDQDDANFTAYENGTYMLLDNLPVSMIGKLKAERLGKDFYISDYIGTFFLPFNANISLKPGIGNASSNDSAWSGWTTAQNAQARLALSLLIDRNYICDQILQGGQIPANGFVPQGMSDGNGSDFRQTGKNWWDPGNVEGNRAQAIEILKGLGYAYDEASKKFTDFPTWVFATNTNTSNIALAEAIQNMWKEYGITVSVEQKDWAVFQTALTDGDFMQARMGWIADYNDPINFLEIFSTSSGNNHPQLGRSGIVGLSSTFGPNADQSWEQYYQADIDAIKVEADMSKRAELMHQAEAKLEENMPFIPLYFYTRPNVCKPELKGVLRSPLGWISFKEAYLETAPAAEQ